jgi:hypothetical protein
MEAIMPDRQTIQFAVREIERYAQTLIEVVEALPEDRLWSVEGGLPNSVGTLARHLTGNLNHYFGAGFIRNGYVREREREFTETGLPKERVLADLRAGVETACRAVDAIEDGKINLPHTAPCGEEYESLGYHILRLATHCAMHAGQADYARHFLRREVGSA